MRIFEQNIRLTTDKKYKEMARSLVRKGGSYKKFKDVQKEPFSRNVDLWFFVFCLAVKKGLDPINVPNRNSYNLTADASVINEDMQAFMAIAAIQHSEDIHIIKDPNAMLKICIEYATAGFNYLDSSLNDGAGKENIEIINKLSNEIMA